MSGQERAEKVFKKWWDGPNKMYPGRVYGVSSDLLALKDAFAVEIDEATKELRQENEELWKELDKAKGTGKSFHKTKS